MGAFSEWIKVLILGILEGITEWLPISSTGHLLLLDRYLHLEAREDFKEVFFVVIQLGAILAVFFLFGNKMLPFEKRKGILALRRQTLSLWLKVVLACIPGAILTLLFDDAIERILYHTRVGEIPLMPLVIALALILYGVVFLLIEHSPKERPIQETKDIRYSDALLIGVFQALSIIPGTSRSGSTVIGAMTRGIRRTPAAEFTFFLAVPVMAGYSLLKLLKFGFSFSPSELFLLLVGSTAAFLTSLAVIRFLLSYVKKHSFAVFGIYRIILGIVILASFIF